METARGVGPTRDGRPLDLSVRCRTNPKASRGKPHPIRIHADWSVETPHDLAAERIAAAFGGFNSCLELVDRTIPAVAASMGILTRRHHVDLHLSEDRKTWHVEQIQGCRCSRTKFRSAQAAAGHLRSAEHLSRRFDTSRQRLEEMIEAVSTASDSPDLTGLPDTPPRVRALVLERSGVADLWEAGIHPDDLPELASCASTVDEPLPVNYFLGLRYSGVDLAWLTRTIAWRPDPTVATWLAWTPAESSLASDDVGAWLELGLARRQIEALTAERVRPTAAHELASGTTRTTHAAARDLALWAGAGCRPTVEQMGLLDRHGLGSTYEPSRTAIDQLVGAAASLVAPPDRTELGVLLALEGSRRNVEVVLAHGVRSAAELATTSSAPGIVNRRDRA